MSSEKPRAAVALLKIARLASADTSLAPRAAVRTAVVLARQALEHAMRHRLARDLPGAERGSFRAQLLCLQWLDTDVGQRTSFLYDVLSSICHHRAYMVAPSLVEVTALLDELDKVEAELAC